MSRPKAKRGKPAVVVSPSIWWLLGLLTALGILAYWNSFDVPLVFDDFMSIQRNDHVRLAQFDWNLLSPRAVLFLTFTFNYWWTGQAVWSYHLVNLLLHLFNSGLLFFIGLHIFRQIEKDETRSRLYALVAASFFLLHPLQTESVTYISSRSELLSTAFYLAAFLIFIKYPVQRIGFILCVLVAAPFVLALGSKETAISLLAVIFLYDFIFLSDGSFKPMLRRWRFYLPFIAGGIGAVVYILTVTLKGAVGVGLGGDGISPLHYFLTELRVIVRYASLIVLPIRQNLDYDIPLSQSLLEPTVLGSFLLLASIAACGWIFRRRQPIVAFSIFWFFLTLAPTSSFAPITDVAFEHRLYLPLAGVCMAFPILMALLQKQVRERFHIQFKYGVYVAVPLALLFTATILRNQVWRDEVRLWADTVSKSPKKDRPRNSLAMAYFKKGQFDDAIRGITQAIDYAPDTRKSLQDLLGNLYLQTGRYDEAVKLFSAATHDSVKLNAVKAYNNLGVTYLYKLQALESQQGKMAPEVFEQEKESVLRNALDAYQQCLSVDPNFFPALHSSINVSFNLGLADSLKARAEDQLKSEHEMKSGEDLRSLYTLAYLAFLEKDYRRACELFERIEEHTNLDVSQKLIYFNHAYALNALQQKDQAIQKYLDALQLDPVFSEARVNIGLLYKERGDYANAIDSFSEVLRSDPNNVFVNLNLAEIAAAQGNKNTARQYLRNVLNVSPSNQQALQDWQKLGL